MQMVLYALAAMALFVAALLMISLPLVGFLPALFLAVSGVFFAAAARVIELLMRIEYNTHHSARSPNAEPSERTDRKDPPPLDRSAQ